MSTKAIKKFMARNRSVARTPINTCSNPQSLRRDSQTVTTISFDSHKKVLTRNNTLARENASFREQIRLLKNENMALKANQVNQELHSSQQILNTFAVVVNYLSEEYSGMKNKFDDLGINIENVGRILNDCLAQLQQNYPEDIVHGFSNNCESNGFVANEANNETINGCGAIVLNDSRKSLSSQERESRRKLSMEKIKRDFHVFSELSTILEQSREQRSSSVIFGRESMHRISGKFTEKGGLVSNSSKPCLKCRISDVPTIGEVDSDAEHDRQEARDDTSTAPNLELSRNKSLKLPLRNSTNCQTLNQSSSNTLVTNLSEVYDIHNKENEMPSVMSSNASRFSLNVLHLSVPQHSSSPVESTINGNQFDDMTKKCSNLIDFSFSDDFTDQALRNSSATVLVEETHDYKSSFADKRFTSGLREVMETPQLRITNSETKERIRSDEQMFESEVISVRNEVELEVSRLAIDSMNDMNKSIAEPKTRSKRLRRNSVRIINYDESSEPENNTECVVTAKKKSKRKTLQSENQKSVVTKTRKAKSQSTQQTEVKKKKKEKPTESKDNLEQRLSIYEFEEESNGISSEKKSVSGPKRSKTKK